MIKQNEKHCKLKAEHLKRKAVVYVRQSSLKQVLHNKESQELQYNLKNRGKELGFSQIEIYDEDLGISAAPGAKTRKGFDRLISMVALNEVGIIFSREISRLLRTDKDFCRLVEVCQIFNTLLGDEIQIYDVNCIDDLLVLGIKGTMSVVELNQLKLRLIDGMHGKARKGKLITKLPPGYIIDGMKNVVKTPDKRIVNAIMMIFNKYYEIQSIRQTVIWFHGEGIKLPVNKENNGRNEITWQFPTYSFIKGVLQNPFYAGAYVWGRRSSKKILKNGIVKKIFTNYNKPEECKVFIKEHHEGYISWQRYEELQLMIKDNYIQKGISIVRGTIRNGAGILGGLLRCGVCGRKMYVYYGKKNGNGARYICRGDFENGGKYCLAFGGVTVDKRFKSELLNAISPYGVKASIEAKKSLEEKNDEKYKAFTKQLQQIEYEVQRAFEQYNAADPRNRLVAGELERRWNEKLEELEKIKRILNKKEDEYRLPTLEEENELNWLGDNLGVLWKKPECNNSVKKKIIRTVIEEVIVNYIESTKMLNFVIHWKGGIHTQFDIEKAKTSQASQKTSENVIDVIRRMVIRYGDATIAGVLNRMGYSTGKGNRWTAERVKSARNRYSMSGQKRTIKDPDIMTATEAAEYCKVSITTIKRLVEEGVIEKKQVVPFAPWEIRRSDLEIDRVKVILKTLQKTGRLIFEGGGLDEKQPELF